MSNKIIVIGSPGSGKSTFAIKAAEKLDLPLYHIDRLFWHGNWENISKAELKEKIEEIVQTDKWIIDGNYSNSLETRLKNADTLIYFDYPTYLCFIRVLKRTFQNFNKSRADMPDECKERIDLDFLLYVLRFRKAQSAKILDLVKEHFRGENLFIVKSKKDYEKMLGKFL